ncbi:epididymal-specific lipocalin-6 isoform X1 [Bubalus bubalis]|uniref:epididymal-specific lipocalin-6 isoform X1 n=1 Tax=Bubalus bubalis TaxID=89462 RepID=UPI001D125388|nr:epididymal-specific lipocalin-6 isoform X1 [Bubalus bubalis]
MLILETSKWRAAGEARVEGAPHTVPAPPCSPARLEDQERGRREPGDECRPHHCVQSHINGRPEAGGPLSPGPGRLLACGPREMRAVLLAALLAVVLVPSAQAVWLGRLDPQQVAAPPHRCGPGATRVLGPLWSPGSPGAPRTMGAAGGRAGGGGTAPHLRPLPQLMGSWYVLAVASGEKDFALEKATKSVEGVAVMLASQSTLKMRASRHSLAASPVSRRGRFFVQGPPEQLLKAGEMPPAGCGAAETKFQMGLRESLPGRAGVPGAGHQLQGLRHSVHAAGGPGGGLQHRGAVQPDGPGQSGGPGPLRQVEPEPGLPVAAAGRAPEGLHLRTQGLPVNAAPTRGPEEAGQTLPSSPSRLGAGQGATCSQGLLLRIQIKQFHKPSRGLLRVSKQGPGPESAAPPGGSPRALGRQEARPPELELDPVVWVTCGQGAGLGRPGRESLAFPGALGQGGGPGTPESRSLSVFLCPEVLAEAGAAGGRGHLALCWYWVYTHTDICEHTQTHTHTHAHMSGPAKGITQAAPASAPARSEPRPQRPRFLCARPVE